MKKRRVRPAARILGAVLLLLVIAALSVAVAIHVGRVPNAPETIADPAIDTAAETAAPITVETTPPEPYVEATATVASTGDILIHNPLLNTARQADGSYDFHSFFTSVQSYFGQYDCMIANLEVPLGGPEAGAYTGYPTFNCPDSLATALKDAGVDMLLTANNHSADKGGKALLRTNRVVREAGMDVLGTRENLEEPIYAVKEINGIPIGMACYTYGRISASGTKSLNGGAWLSGDVSPLINVFDYDKIDAFYAEAQMVISDMKAAGAAVTVFYLHWGNEYQYKQPNSWQKQIAQRLADFGVDIIVGGHPHVVQPVETLTGAGGNKTVCIYSMGNSVSNQRKEVAELAMPSGHTEDGMIFSFTIEKWSDGTYRLSEVNILPTWVYDYMEGGKRFYRIIPLDTSVPDWSAFQLGEKDVKDAKDSYNRTMALAGEGLNAARAALGLEARPLSVS